MSLIIIPKSLRKAYEMRIDGYLKTGNGPMLHVMSELMAVRRNREEFPVELTRYAIAYYIILDIEL